MTSLFRRFPRPVPAALVLVMLLVVAGAAEPAVAGVEGSGSAGSSGTAATSGPPNPLSAPVGVLPGIDVSHWQGTIDWAAVAGTGQRFVFAKATEGQTFGDPMYLAYKQGASAAGLAFAAYHFARPDASANDAVLEADHFVQVAQVGAGNLLPVLDIEVSGGLDAAALTAWALTWLGEVRARLGVMPLVYTSPNGWKTRFGDTTAVADAGYPLWVAHWGVSSPTVPANDWGGHGWTFWQYTDCGSVSGIGGCVDLDRFDGTDLGAATIRRLTVSLASADGVVTSSPAGISCGAVCSANYDPGATVTLTATPNAGKALTGWSGACTGTGACTVTMTSDLGLVATFGDDLAPSVTFATPVDPGGAVTATFSEVVHQVTKSNVVVRFQGKSADVPATLTCRSPTGKTVTCSTGNVLSVERRPLEPLLPGQIYSAIVAADASTPIVDAVGNAVSTTSQDFLISTEVEQESPALAYRWPIARNPDAFGRSYSVERLAGASASFTFRGRRVTWYTMTGPAQGKAEVTIDGRSKGTFDQYASSTRFRVPRTFDSLARGEHTITVTVLGRKTAKAGDRRVSVDAFAVGHDLVANPALEVSWRVARAAEASDGAFATSDLAGASVTLRFAGSALEWTTIRGPDQGRAQVFIDGTLVKTVDGYAPEQTFGVVRSFGGLADGVHTLRIVVTGTSRRSATGALITLDRLLVVG
jgi:GH25 family lysozyme M1 (1,4-beta-N-acetylmuramidase)